MNKKMTNIIIREFQENDADAVCRMMEELLAEHGTTVNVDVARFTEFYHSNNEDNFFLVAVCDDVPVGFAQSFDRACFYRQDKMRHIEIMYVKEEFRNKKIGLQLVQAMTKDAEEKGCSSLGVTAKKANEGANRFYINNGFVRNPDDAHRYHIKLN